MSTFMPWPAAMQAKLVAVVLRPDPPFVPARQIIITAS
jgi:hypothetical protein